MSVLSIFCRPEITVKRPRSWRACLHGKHLLSLFKLDFGGAAGLVQIYGSKTGFPSFLFEYWRNRVFFVFIYGPPKLTKGSKSQESNIFNLL